MDNAPWSSPDDNTTPSGSAVPAVPVPTASASADPPVVDWWQNELPTADLPVSDLSVYCQFTCFFVSKPEHLVDSWGLLVSPPMLEAAVSRPWENPFSTITTSSPSVAKEEDDAIGDIHSGPDTLALGTAFKKWKATASSWKKDASSDSSTQDISSVS